MWKDCLGLINDNPHKIRQILFNEERFLNDINHRIEVLKTVELSFVDGFYAIKSLLETLYSSDFNDSKLLKDNFSEDDQLMLKYVIAREILGNLIQYNRMDNSSVPLKYNIMARNYLLIKLQGQKDIEILQNMEKLNVKIDLVNLNKIMDEIIANGFISKTKEGNNYLFKLEKELTLSEEAEKKYNATGLQSLVKWPTQFWRSFYNIRELNVTVDDSIKHSDFLLKILSKSATQGFGPADYVFKNLVKYYETIKN